MIEEIIREVAKIMSSDNSGHGMDHVNRVYQLATSFAKEEGYDEAITGLIALLHDVDDYKLFGSESNELANAKYVMKICSVPEETQKIVVSELKTIGFSKYLKGLRPTTKEGMAVSDADMCDALGAIGIARVFTFGNSISRPLFDRNKFPSNEETYEFHMVASGSTINFIFEVLLKYKDIMLTEAGKKVATERHEIIVNYLRQYFIEENAPEWIEYLEKNA